MQELVSAESLRRAQSLYQSSADDKALAFISNELNNAINTELKFISVDRISHHNQEALKALGYKIDYYSDQREGTYYTISW